MPLGLNSPRYLSADPAGKFLYITNFASSTGNYGVTACTIDPTTGALGWINGAPGGAAGSSYTTGYTPFRSVVDPLGKYLYVGNYSSASVSGYTIGSDGYIDCDIGLTPST